MNTLPLMAERPLSSRIANWRGEAVNTAAFVAQAEQLARALPDARHCINLAENRFHFLLGWVAACLRGQIMLLPPNQLPAVLGELQREYPGHHVFDDATAETLLAPVPAATVFPDWQLPADRVVAVVFTSGSTGKPQAHPKTWGSLFHNSRLAARDVLGGIAHDEKSSGIAHHEKSSGIAHDEESRGIAHDEETSRIGRHIVATVPSQHMYGLEASLLGALSAGCCIHDLKPFFPADVRAALAAMPGPRTLVTTPAHLKILTAAGIELPALHRVVSATAPLPPDLAAQAESLWRTEVFEIFGCTEAGVMAHRRTTSGPRWRTLEGGRVVQRDGAAEYRAPQLPFPTPLQDVIEPHGETEFVLLGRAADMIKVAGKRTSLQELTRQVSSVPGVQDAVVFLRDGEERPAAAVVAPGLDAPRVLTALRGIMEPVFVPRPLIVVDRLPRNELGKLPREALLRLFATPDDRGVIRIPADHPSLAGHFPGNPLVPGVVLLDAVLAHIKESRPGALQALPSVKFLAPVRPGDSVQLRVEFQGSRARFTGLRDATPVFEGSLVFAGEAP